MMSGRMQQMAAATPRVAVPVVVSLATAGSAYGAAYLDEYLSERGAEKMGPFKLVPLLGFGLSAISLFVPDADVQAGLMAVGNGVGAVGMGDAGRQKRKLHKAAVDNLKAQPKK